MERFVIVRSNRLNAFGTKMNSDVCRVENMFRDGNNEEIAEKETRLLFHMNLPDRMFNQNLINIEESTIIVFDGHVRIEFLQWIMKNNPGKRIILWLWNTVEEIRNNLQLDRVPKEIEIWSYSEHDCKEYGFHYNTTFFWDKKKPMEGPVEHDLYFIGKDKGRLKKVKYIDGICKKNGINFIYHVTKTHKYSLPKKEYKTSISYSEVQKSIASSKGILDLRVSCTAGPSLRALEAAFYRKKLVTDDENVKTFRFYNKHNIFIISENNMDNLKSFLDSPLQMVNEDDIEYYNARNWLSRFCLVEEKSNA